jgi:glycerol transport system ATP-binding protein
MARIELDLAHSYRPNPQQDSDYALLPLKMDLKTAAPMRCSAPRAAARPPCSTSCRACWCPSHGKVLFDGRDVTRATPQDRNIAQVFQFPVIYDTMTVAENLAFPLRNRKVPEDQIKQRVGQIAEMLEMSGQLDQRAAGPGGRPKQKISLGRGLVRSDVAAVLFDEPLTVIDPHLKWQLRRKLKQIHHELKLTLIYVTHDQVEALTFADQVVVMTRGRAVQLGTPRCAVRKARAHLRGPLHRLAGHELPARACGRRRHAAGGGQACCPCRPRLPAGALQVGCGPNTWRWPPRKQPAPCRATWHRCRTSAPTRCSPPQVGDHTIKARPRGGLRPPGAG